MDVEQAMQVLTEHGINGEMFEKLLKIRADSTPRCDCGNESPESSQEAPGFSRGEEWECFTRCRRSV